jgi:hypothetical protein
MKQRGTRRSPLTHRAVNESGEAEPVTISRSDHTTESVLALLDKAYHNTKNFDVGTPHHEFWRTRYQTLRKLLEAAISPEVETSVAIQLPSNVVDIVERQQSRRSIFTGSIGA